MNGKMKGKCKGKGKGKGKGYMAAIVASAVLLGGCSALGLTSKSTEEQCVDALAKDVAQFCKAAADNRDKIDGARKALQ